MVENILYWRPKVINALVREESSGQELSKEMHEMQINEENKKTRSKCEMCVIKNPLSEGVAVFLCFLCQVYVCVNCMPDHSYHEGMKIWKMERHRDKDKERRVNDKMGQQSQDEKTNYNGKGFGKNPKRLRLEDSKRERLREKSENTENTIESEILSMLKEENERDRMREKSERDRMRRKYIAKIINESKIQIEEKFNTNHVSIYDRVLVKHVLDEADCNITGLCGLGSNRWVVCDRLNYCMKIFKLGSNVLQRYIRFDSQPWDVTEIQEKQNCTTPHFVSRSIPGFSVRDGVEPDITLLVAVTFPWKRQITFIALHKKPAILYKKVFTEKECYFIQFYDNKIFTVCREDLSPCSVCIKSTDGDTLSTFDTGITSFVPHFAVVSGRVYLSDLGKNKLQCRNIDGQAIAENTIKRSRPEGISVDPDCNVYICASLSNEVYKLDSDLIQYKSVLDKTTDYVVKNPDMLCYYRDRLFISHHQASSLENCITVVCLL